MIEVHICEDGITIQGHAGYAPQGEDIVCAAVSALFQTLIQSILNLTEDTIKYRLLPGESKIQYQNLSEKTQTLIDSFFIGISMVAKEYPAYIRIV